MLKIKDDVDLERLRDFGFIVYQCIDDGEYYYCIFNFFIGKDRIIKQDDGINECNAKDEFDLDKDELGLLYDLIQAGLVEKVDDK